MPLSLSTMFMHLNLYIHNILLSVTIVDHSVMQSFSIDEKKLAQPQIFREKNIILCSISADKGANNMDFCCSVLSNDLKPVYFISLGRFQIDFYWLSLTTLLFVTNCPCWAQRKHKIRHLCNWMLFSFKLTTHQKGHSFCMKIRTFLQIVRSGKITASPKANLSINKKIVLHKFNAFAICAY